MKLILLGTGGYYPTSQRHTACLLLPEIGVVLDAGSGMCRLGEYLATEQLDIFLTHAHLDHVLGLTYLVNVVPADVVRQSTVHGDAAKLAAVREHLFDEAIFPVEPPFRFAALDASFTLAGGGSLTHFPLAHPGGSIGFRLDWPGHSLAYVTDTTADAQADYVERIRGVDLLVHECYFADNDGELPAITGHSWLLPVAEVAAAAEVGRLVLVHIGPHYGSDDAFDLAAARRIFNNTQLGVDRCEFEF
ncbi:MAG: MBL fold metallo-hydrolase [Pirellulales bacterium]